MKKLIVAAFAVVTAVALCVPALAFAATPGTNGTITVSNAAVGKDYKAYRILEATYSGDAVAYTTKAPNVIGASGSPFSVATTADANGNYAVTLQSGKTVADISDWIKNNLSSFTAINPTSGASGATATSTTVSWSNLTHGYYYVTSSLGSFVSIDTVTPSASIVDKNPTAPSDLEKANDSETAQIGDVVKFTVTFKATSFVTTNDTDDNGKVTAVTTQVTKYSVSDQANGFDYLVDSGHPVTVKVGTREATTVSSPSITQQTSDTDPGTMRFDINWSADYNYSEDVTIIYYGIVNEFADDGDAVNTVSVVSNADEEPMTHTTTTKTYYLTVNKRNESNEQLTGAKFELYRNDETAPLALVDITASGETNKTYRIAEPGESGTTTTIDMTGCSTATIYGLDGADTYKLLETEAPGGYNKLDGTTDHAMENASGSENIKNQAGTVLPSTGGMGTTILYIVGGIMVAVAAVFLVSRRRASKSNKSDELM